MYLIEAFFTPRSRARQHIADLSYLVNQIIEQWRYNGQIIGREIPLFRAELAGETGLAVRVVCPEQQSLLTEYNNTEVDSALETAESAGLFFDGFQIIADDLNSDTTHSGAAPSWQILYTTYLQSCSPLHSGDDFLPIPLYKQLKNVPHLSMDIIKWQENWQACDQLQMNGAVLEQQALREIADTDSNLFKHGYYLARDIERISGIATYYYLYRLGGDNLAGEQQRRCPLCGQPWALPRPLFDLFYFKCDHCRIVSNLSWHWQ
ncbi:Zn-ribbon-containing protein [Necropsobacter rosorum]|uniref:Zn-ribbon-containing protein n=1 Tax=Necropsobacter rosorum TaxID=908285 RepID=UPI000509EE02